jgi:predicted phage replisome organizer
MAESKRYYWLKLQHDFFGSKRMKKLRTLENGDTCLIIYLKMQLKSIKDDGVLVYSGLEASFEEELALDLDEDVDNVTRTVKFLMKYDLLEVLENKYTLPYAQGNTGSETAAAERMRAFRKKKQEQPCNIVQTVENKPEQKSKVVPIEKPKKETMLQLYERISENGQKMKTPKIDSKMRVWMKYKTEKKEPYQETGLATLLKRVNKYVDKYGDEAVCELIDKCMSSNWSGIIWEKLDNGEIKTRAQRIGSRVSEVDNW